MKKYTQAFTLIELLVVITIIAILIGLLFPVVGAVREQAQKVVANANLTSIVVGVGQYNTDYGLFPPEEMQVEAGDDNSQLMNILRARENEEDSNYNPRKVKYLQGKNAKTIGDDRYRDGFTPDGQYVDPWTRTFGVFWDDDYNGAVEVPEGGVSEGEETTVDKDVLSWSLGKDGDLGTRDDVTTWN